MSAAGIAQRRRRQMHSLLSGTTGYDKASQLLVLTDPLPSWWSGWALTASGQFHVTDAPRLARHLREDAQRCFGHGATAHCTVMADLMDEVWAERVLSRTL